MINTYGEQLFEDNKKVVIELQNTKRKKAGPCLIVM